MDKESEYEATQDSTPTTDSLKPDQPIFYTPKPGIHYPITGIRPIRPSYLTLASEEPVQLENPRKILVILDLNGTLFHRTSSKSRTADPRPFLHYFLRFLFTNCRVMIWSSASPSSVNMMLKTGFGDKMKLIDRVWDRSHFRLHEEDYSRKVLTLKDLEFVWEEVEAERLNACEEELMEGGKNGMQYDQTNTVLIDDSIHKSQLQPYNRIVLADFDKELSKSKADNELLKVKNYLEILLTQQNVSAYIMRHPFDSANFHIDPLEAIAMVKKSKKKSRKNLKPASEKAISAAETPEVKIKSRSSKRIALRAKMARINAKRASLASCNDSDQNCKEEMEELDETPS
ncbi:hypothetical protein BGZ76_002793 [Entomortierella beljakovae]|nr:hypothetical protein BGZ76_002793 [Entomortierella beljakovae]